jgi:hypothetical protein
MDGLIAPRNPGPTFSFTELALAGGMTRRAFQHVIEAGLLPLGGDIRTLKRDIRTLKRIAAIGGFAAPALSREDRRRNPGRIQ